jgi:hypothetical protein
VLSPISRSRSGATALSYSIEHLLFRKKVLPQETLNGRSEERRLSVEFGRGRGHVFFGWTVILLTRLRSRQSVDRTTLQGLPRPLRAYPLRTLASMAAISAIAFSTFWVDGLQYTPPTFVPLLLVLSVVYVRHRTRHQPNGV